jgi:hypothetical protein
VDPHFFLEFFRSNFKKFMRSDKGGMWLGMLKKDFGQFGSQNLHALIPHSLSHLLSEIFEFHLILLAKTKHNFFFFFFFLTIYVIPSTFLELAI